MPYKDPAARRAYDKQRYLDNHESVLAQQRQYYLDNRDARLAAIRLYSKNRLTKLRDIVMELKKRPCMDCKGHFHFAAMDFDHRPGEVKVQNITDLMRNQRTSVKNLQLELAKCDLVCSNCHRVRTYNRRIEDDNLEEP